MNLNKRTCYLAIPWDRNYSVVEKAVSEAINLAGIHVAKSQNFEFDNKHQSSNLQDKIAQSDLVIADISKTYPNVFFDVGQARAMGKPILFIKEENSRNELHSFILDTAYITYSKNSLGSLVREVSRFIHNFVNNRFQPTGALSPTYALPFFVDWERLNKRDMENLCQELMSQLGFRHLRWSKELMEIDLIAELPRKDPDGFEFKELWLVSTGQKASYEKILEMAIMDSEFFIHRISRYSLHHRRSLFSEGINGFTFLIIDVSGESQSKRYVRLIDEIEERQLVSRKNNFAMRVRFWDRGYMTSLIQQHQHIGYKYFSDEGRIRSKSRKSFEELYRENNNLMADQRKLISDLKTEKDARVRAERDAVWKDISFSAAHRIGNPIFAIETAIDPLRKRVLESRADEAIEVIGIISSATVKAKAFIDQFKSLTRAQKIDKVVSLVKPIILESIATAASMGVKTKIECPSDLTISCDPERIAECFDELAANAMHWMRIEPKLIDVIVMTVERKKNPEMLDSNQDYIKINFRDNGPGILVENKNSIFEAFFTNYEHGTGLGLALVRRVVEGHGGAIIEVGEPGKGADFEIYLPRK